MLKKWLSPDRNQNQSAITLFIVSVFFTSVLSSCGGFRMLKGEGEAFQNDTIFNYRIQRGDKLALSVRSHPELSVGSIFEIYNANEVYGRWVLVQPDGTADFPEIENLSVVGYTVQQLADSIAKHHAAIIRSPEVVVKVMNLEATVLGEVKNPGTYLMDKDRVDLLELLAKSGGLNYYAKFSSVEIIRQREDGLRKYEVDLSKFETVEKEKIWIYPHDVVYVRARNLMHFEKRIGNAIPIASVLTAIVLIITLK